MWVLGFCLKIVFNIVLEIWFVILFGWFFDIDFEVNRCLIVMIVLIFVVIC